MPRGDSPVVVAFEAPKQKIDPIEQRIMLARDFWGEEEEPIEWIVEDLIAKGLATLFAGRAGFGKTYSSQMLQTACALGCDWLGRKIKQCKSLGVYSEDPRNRLKSRQIRICEHYNVDLLALHDWASLLPNDDGDFLFFSCFRKSHPGTARGLWHELEARCIAEQTELLILDNLQNIFGGDPNNKIHVNSCMRWFNSRARAMNCAIVILCNPPKDGSSYFSHVQTWEDAARQTLSLGAAEDDNGKVIEGEFVLSVPKSSYLAYNHPLKRRGIRLMWESDVLVHPPETPTVALDELGRLDLDMRVAKAVSHTVSVLGWKLAADPSSPNYLPGKLASAPSWRHIAWGDLVASLERLLTAGKLIKVAVKDTWLVRTPDSQPYLGEAGV